MTVWFTGLAQCDLEDIADFIAQDNPVRAVCFVREVRAAYAEIALFPQAYRLTPGLENLDIRDRSYGRYSLFYKTSGDRVEVLRIAHSARDHLTAFDH